MRSIMTIFVVFRPYMLPGNAGKGTLVRERW
jgi:hypothetical protein